MDRYRRAQRWYDVGRSALLQDAGRRALEGRDFDGRDTMGGPRVGIVSETLARHVWPNGGAVGRMITVGSDRVEVVGAVKALQWTSALQ